MPGLSGEQITTTLLKALPADLAEQVLKKLAPPVADRLRIQMATNTTPATPTQIDESLGEFFDLYRISERGRALGILTDKAQAGKPGGPAPEDLGPDADGSDPIGSLRALPLDKLQKVLEGESPAAITLIMSVLEPANAAVILGGLPPEVRSDVAVRFTRPGDRNYSLIKQLAKAIAERGQKLEEALTTAAPEERISDLAMMLRKLPRPDRVALLQTMDTTDAELGQRVREKLYRFDDVLKLDDRATQGLLSQLNLKVIAKCLKGAEETISKKITNNISARARDLLQEELSLLGSVTPAQVEEARKEFLATLRQAEEQGTVTIAD
jgi:flagellar motor switch protein FliG